MIGQKRLHYIVSEKLGAGGMGIVYKAHDTRLDRPVALKFLSERLALEDADHERFIQEAKAAAALNHPNIATIYAIEQDEIDTFIVMEYIAGLELGEYLSQIDEPLAIEQCIDYGRQIASALKTAHDHGIVHRDIKSSNIMITDQGQAKIMDFGLAKLAGGSQLTQVGTTLGTAAYMAPEQTRGEEVDHRVDIWSYGIVFYEMLTGQMPFTGEYESAIIYSVLNDAPIPVHSVRPEVPSVLSSVVDGALNKDRDTRYQSADEILELLDELADDHSATHSMPRRVSETGTKPVSGARWMLYGILLTLLCLVVFFIFWPDRDDSTRQISVLILPYDHQNIEVEWSWLGSAISDLVRRELKNYQSMHVVGGEQQLRLTGLLGAESVPDDVFLRALKQAGVTNVVSGALFYENELIKINTEVVDVNEQNNARHLDPVQAREDDLFSVASEISGQLTRQLNIRDDAGDSLERTRASSSLDAYRYFIEGQKAVFDFRHREGITKLRKSIELDSTFVDAYYWLAWQYRQLGDVDNARNTLVQGQRYVESLSDDMKLEYFCNLASVESRWDDYSAHLQNLIELQPRESVHHYRYGWVLCNKFRDFDNGIIELKKAVELDSTNGMILNELGYAFIAMGERSQAKDMFEKYVSLHATDLNPLDSKADMLVQTGEYEAALQICERVIARNADFMPVYLTRSNTLMEMGRFDEALRSVNDYLNLAAAPNGENSFLVSQGLTNKARILLRMQQNEDALSAAKSAATLNPANLEAILLSGMASLALNEKTELSSEIVRMQELVAKDGNLDGKWFVDLLSSEIALKNGDAEGAVQLLRQAVTLKPLQHNLMLNKLAEALLESGNTEEASKVYKDVLAFNPNYTASILGLARSFEQTGRIPQALAQYQRVKEVLADADAESIDLQTATARYTGLTLSGNK